MNGKRYRFHISHLCSLWLHLFLGCKVKAICQGQISRSHKKKKKNGGCWAFVFQKHILFSKLFRGSFTSMGHSDEVQKQLQEASQTAYVGGRWIYTSNQFRIIMPTLPALGDYTQYNVLGMSVHLYTIL